MRLIHVNNNIKASAAAPVATKGPEDKAPQVKEFAIYRWNPDKPEEKPHMQVCVKLFCRCVSCEVNEIGIVNVDVELLSLNLERTLLIYVHIFKITQTYYFNHNFLI